MEKKTIKVAIADYNRELVEMIQKYLKHQPDIVVVGVAYNGEDILAIVNEHNPEIIVFDVILPIFDGIAVLEKINEMNDKRPRVLIITSFVREAIIQWTLKLGADYYLQKPFHMDVLLKRIHQLADEKSMSTTINSYLLEKEATDLIRIIGIPTHLKGYHYIREAVVIAVENKGAKTFMARLYSIIAKRHHDSYGGVDGAIRKAIQVVCNRGNEDRMNQLFGLRQEGPTKISNAKFITMIAEEIKYRIITQNYGTSGPSSSLKVMK